MFVERKEEVGEQGGGAVAARPAAAEAWGRILLYLLAAL